VKEFFRSNPAALAKVRAEVMTVAMRRSAELEAKERKAKKA
jgi:hypothetical protein